MNHITKFKLTEEFIRKLALTYKQPFKNNGLGDFVNRRTYSRTDETGKSEDLVDIITRVVTGTMNVQRRHFAKKGLVHLVDEESDQAMAQELAECFLQFKALPPGRGLWAMGSPLTEERHLYAALNNCAFVSTQSMFNDDPVKPFTFLMDMSMMGVGTGFDTKGAGSVFIPHELSIVERHHVIADSREGWVHSLTVLLEHYFKNGPKPIFDFSQVREAGLPIKGFGGISGGPEPLREMLTKIGDVLDKHRGRDISVTGIVDIMNMIGKCIVSGNVRRTAEIAFGDPDDDSFLNLKDYTVNPHRMDFGWTSNNSVFAEVGKTDYQSVMERTWQTGEPGFIWLDNKRAFSRMKDPADFRDHKAAGTNPCLTGDTIITTSEGPKRMDSLIGKPFKVLIRNKEYSTTPKGVFITGRKQVVTVRTLEGPTIRLTKDHRVLVVDGDKHAWRKTRNLKVGDYLMFNNNREVQAWPGPGNYEEGLDVGKNHHLLRCPQTTSGNVLPGTTLPKVVLPENGINGAISWSENVTLSSYAFHKGFLTGCLVRQNTPVLLSPLFFRMEDPILATRTQTVLTNLGIRSYLSVNDVRVHNDDIRLLSILLEMPCLTQSNPKDNADSFFYLTVYDVYYASHEFETVYDCTIDDPQHAFSANGIVVHNCVEQTLESYELCNLGETFPFNHDNHKDYMRTLELMHFYTKTVTLGETNWAESNAIIARNRRMGISMSGIFQFIHHRGFDELQHWCDTGYAHLKDCDRQLSAKWQVEESIKLTSVKPSGTVSLLAGATPGIHAPINTQYIRRVRFPTNSSWAKPLMAAGYKVEKAQDGHNTSIVEFPVNLGDALRCQHDQSAFEQLSNAAFMQRHWADNSVSCTVAFDPQEETPKSLAKLLQHFDSQLKGISFLPTPKSEPIRYAQPPYEKISIAQYYSLIKGIKPILFDQSDSFVPKEHSFCDGDVCTRAT